MAFPRRFAVLSALSVLLYSVSAQTTDPAHTATTKAATPSITAVSDCHPHGTVQYCMAGTSEYQVLGPTKTEEMESQYTGCHSHGTETFCYKSDGDEVELLVEAPEGESEHTDEDTEHTESEEPTGERSCHFHAGVEHCVGGSEQATCSRVDREYNVPLRIGLLFVILVTGALGVFTPILATSFTRMSQKSIVFVILKQFGTGVVISTAFVHLFTHAGLMFANECLGELKYEATTAGIFMAGLFLSFLVDYMGARFMLWRQGRKESTSPVEIDTDRSTPTPSDKALPVIGAHASHIHRTAHIHGSPDEKLSVVVLEAGIIFHSLLIGLTLVVAGDSFFLTLFAVIVFHQMFEGIALGTCIAGLPSSNTSLLHKFLLATAFTFITPIGMAIGIGVLGQFNGNSPSTIVAIGTLDALSAGILAWVGIVEMLAKDWMHGILLHAGMVRAGIAMSALVSGMVIMSVLGKWA